MRELRNAARRGVRVRILIDDLYSVEEDRVLCDLAAMPNIEVRLFNPFVNLRANRFTRVIGAALQLARVDRRMHNKLFIADNAAAVMGGRNIADEYFMTSRTSNFVDLDLFVAGPAVRDLSHAFDNYWNSSLVVPIKRLVGPNPSIARAQEDFDQLMGDASPPPLDELPAPFQEFGTLPAEIAALHIRALTIAPAKVLADDPDKSRALDEPNFPTVTRSAIAMLGEAQHEAVIVSPYFVPGEQGMKMMRAARAQGGRIVLVTNSLASTDSPLAQAGYMRYRKDMLEAGVIIHELSPSQTRDRKRLGAFGSSSGSLHAKVITVDQSRVFIGSMNLDFRSAYENTEVGIIIESPEIAQRLIGLLDDGSFYNLRIGPNAEVQWVLGDEAEGKVYGSDPETSWLERLAPELLSPIIPESEL